jgi:hypothetical protein
MEFLNATVTLFLEVRNEQPRRGGVKPKRFAGGLEDEIRKRLRGGGETMEELVDDLRGVEGVNGIADPDEVEITRIRKGRERVAKLIDLAAFPEFLLEAGGHETGVAGSAEVVETHFH